nr:DUF4388 domain-containing protein [uncultured Holophaga sp.]
MHNPDFPRPLPLLMGALRQQRSEGELRLEQNDGTRHFFWVDGELVYIGSEVAGEQFGNYLLRQGVLDFAALNELLATGEAGRLGEKVVLWGLMTAEDRDLHLGVFLGQAMVHALEHPVIRCEWMPRPVSRELSQDLKFRLDHRHFVWGHFQEASHLADLVGALRAEEQWRWEAVPGILQDFSDLPFTPQMAFTLSCLGAEPLGFSTFMSLGSFGEQEAARFLASLWAIGALRLVEGSMPLAPPTPVPEPFRVAPDLPHSMPPTPPTVPELRLEEPVRPVAQASEAAAPVEVEAPAIELEEPPAEPGEDSLARARRLFLTGRHLLASERYGEALKALEGSLQLDPDSPQAYDPWLALGKLRLGNPAWSSRAIEAFQNAARLRPRSAEPWRLMGDLYDRKGFRANAQVCYRKALELDPASPVPALTALPEEVPESGMSGLLGRFKAMLTRADKRP